MTQLHRIVGSLTYVVAGIVLLSIVELVAASRVIRRRDRVSRANVWLTAMTLCSNVILVIVADAGTEALWGQRPGLFARTQVPVFLVPVVAVLVLDFSTYVAHVSMHHLPLLWRVHRVHHADFVVDVTTALRQHPFETAWRFLFIVIPVLALGIPPQIVAAYRILSVTNGLFEHLNLGLWAPLDRLLSFAFITPNVHKVHHSKDPAEADTNYGNLFSIFDRLFRTFTSPSRASRGEYGLHDYDDAKTERVGRLLELPFRDRFARSSR
jgi:sterol desaturase/sphingolipid hydroxylase (fatty acid hydroxylase superfamily)